MSIESLSQDCNELASSIPCSKPSFDVYDNNVADVLTVSGQVDREIFQRNNNSLPLANNFSDIGLSTCKNIQIGTRIITSNLTLVDQKKSDSQEDNVTEKCNSIFRQSSKDNYCWIACTKPSKWFLVIIFGILILMLVFTAISYNNHHVTTGTTLLKECTTFDELNFRDSLTHVEQANSTYLSLITREDWGAHPARPCNKNLTSTNKIKIMMTHMSCNSFCDCQKTMQNKQNTFLKLGLDLFYHYGISETGAIYEGISNKCETRPAYRKCNESYLIILFFFGSNICLNRYGIEKQIDSFNKLVTYNQQKGVISNDSLEIKLFFYCYSLYYSKLNETYANVEKYSKDIEYSC